MGVGLVAGAREKKPLHLLPIEFNGPVHEFRLHRADRTVKQKAVYLKSVAKALNFGGDGCR